MNNLKSVLPQLQTDRFASLVRGALWQKEPEASLFQGMTSSEWEQIFRLSEEQALSAFLYDSIIALPDDLQPPRKILLQFFAYTLRTEQSNQVLSQRIRELDQELKGLGLPYILLKGHSNAALYPVPEHRTPGDIDLFFVHSRDYQRANEYAQQQGYRMDAPNVHHRSYQYKDVHVENHHTPAYFGFGKYDRLFQKRLNQALEGCHGVLPTFSLPEEINTATDRQPLNVAMLPATFNAYFIFEHLFHHFIELGIGLRQVCDWVLHCHKRHNEIDREELKAIAQEFDHLYAMTILATLAVDYLGADPSVFPFDTQTYKGHPHVQLMWEEILLGGNFGYNLFKKRKFASKLHRKWVSYLYTVQRMNRIKPLAPKHISPLPWLKVLRNIKLLFLKE